MGAASAGPARSLAEGRRKQMESSPSCSPLPSTSHRRGPWGPSSLSCLSFPSTCISKGSMVLTGENC